MNLLHRLWRELVVPRGHVRHRFYRVGRRSRAGIALLMVMTTLLFLTVLVTEIGFAATVRLQLAAHERDEARAEALAYTGFGVYRLLLVANVQLGKVIDQYAGMLQQFGVNPGSELWQMLPSINTNLLRMLAVVGSTPAEDDLEEYRSEGLTEAQIEESRESSGSERNFLDFDGDFFATVTDEDSKINVARIKGSTYADLLTDPHAVRLHHMMSGTRNCAATVPFGGGASVSREQLEDHDQFFYEKNLDRWELIANLADWIDVDSDRLFQGGAEETLYNRLEDPYMPKNAPFDSLSEVRLVDGWHRDDVWERYGEKLTVYGSGKVNVNSAECDVMWGLVKSALGNVNDQAVADRIRMINEQKVLMMFSSPQQFVQIVAPPNDEAARMLQEAISTRSTVFRVTSTGVVNESSVTIEAVLDFSKGGIGTVEYWRVE